METQFNHSRIKSLYLLMLIILGFLFTGCTLPQSTEGGQVSATNPASSQPTQTETPPTLTSTPSATLVEQPVTNVSVNYVNALNELPGLNGKLAISIMGLSNLAYLQNLTTNEQIFLGDLDWDFSLVTSVSPDREKFVLLDPKGQNLLVDSNGNILQQLNQISPTSGIYGWLDDDRLIVTDDWENKDYYRLAFTTLMNIYSNEIVPLEPLYPDFGTLETNWGNNLAIYHPQLPLVVYPAVKNKLSTVNLFDLEKKQVLAEIPAFIWGTERPQWSPDGKYLLLAGVLNNVDPDKDQEIYLVDTTGIIVIKTLFANHIPKEVFKSFSWSPNSQKIAFWIGDFGPIDQLAILDVNSGIVVKYDLFAHSRWSGPPIWSPDSHYVAISQIMNYDDCITTLLHLDSGNVFNFSTDPDLRLDGWVK